MTGLTKNEQEALKLFKERVLAVFPDKIETVKLFGSKARGEASKFSDVDVFVILKNGDWRDHRPIRSIATDILLETEIDLSIHIFSTDRISDMRRLHSPFLMHVDQEGVLV